MFHHAKPTRFSWVKTCLQQLHDYLTSHYQSVPALTHAYAHLGELASCFHSLTRTHTRAHAHTQTERHVQAYDFEHSENETCSICFTQRAVQQQTVDAEIKGNLFHKEARTVEQYGTIQRASTLYIPIYIRCYDRMMCWTYSQHLEMF